jgi:hypothetical protein
MLTRLLGVLFGFGRGVPSGSRSPCRDAAQPQIGPGRRVRTRAHGSTSWTTGETLASPSDRVLWIRAGTKYGHRSLVHVDSAGWQLFGEVIQSALSDGEYVVGVKIEHSLDLRPLSRALAEWRQDRREHQ